VQSGWIRAFGLLRSHEKCQILKCAGRGAELRRSDERRQNF
jgi:hypothetical protein